MMRKGTPHPTKKRQPLREVTNILPSSSKAPPARDNSSPLKRLHGIHNSVDRLAGRIDNLVTGIHKQKLAEKLTADEFGNFIQAMQNVEDTLRNWHSYFVEVGRRPSVPKAIERLQRTQPDVNNDNLIPIASPASARAALHGGLSDSPLVSGGQESRDDGSRKVLRFTPQLSSRKRSKVETPAGSTVGTVRFPSQTPSTSSSTSKGKKVTFADTPKAITPKTNTPKIRITLVKPSPPRSARIRGPSMSSSSSSSCFSTPSIIRAPVESPSSMELSTPQPPEEIVNKYPWVSSSADSDKSSGIALSPPKTCALLDSSGKQDERSPMAVPVSPFRTPGLVLRSPSIRQSPDSDSGSEDLSSKLSDMNL